MKIVVSIRSNSAYELVKTNLALSKKLSNVTVTDNVTSLEMLEDFIRFYEADIYLIDKAIIEAQQMIEMLESYEKKYLLLEDLKQVDIQIVGESNEELPEESIINVPLPEKQEKEVIVKKIEKEIFVDRYRAIPPVKILIGGLYSGTGSTTIATNLAKMFAKRGIDVTYIEAPFVEPYMYDKLQIDQSEEKYENIMLKIAKKEMPKNNLYYQDGIHWIVNDPMNNAANNFSFEQLNLILNYAKTTVTIIDVSNNINHSEVLKLMTLTDANYITLEANPIKNDYHVLIKEELSLLEKGNIPYELILTKTNIKNLPIKDIKNNLPKKTFIDLPYISYENLMNCIFNLKFYYDTVDGGNFFEKHFKKIIGHHLPKDFVEINRKNGIFKLFK